MLGSKSLSLIGSFALGGLFVGSLYIWSSKHGRDHPTTIKQRFCSVFTVAVLSPVILKFFISAEKFSKYSTLDLLGLRLPGFLPAAILPLILTMVLFLGPLSMLNFDDIQQCLDVKYWFRNLIWLRNIIIGPLAEEFTFRACMMPLLLQCYDSFTSIYICSLFFGLAHLHHVIERFKIGEPYKMLFIRAAVQFFYTTLFGGYSAFLFLKTGHFIAPFVVHAFCNAMAFPDFSKIFTYPNPKRTVIMCLFLLGVILWYLLLEPLTNYKLYENNIYFSNSVIVND